jgi:hypothetical protein
MTLVSSPTKATPIGKFKSTLRPIYDLRVTIEDEADDEVEQKRQRYSEDINQDSAAVQFHMNDEGGENIIVHELSNKSQTKSTTSHNTALSEVYVFAKFIHSQTLKRVYVNNAMNYIMSVGGGWASIRNSNRSRECSRILALLAASVGDTATVRKCQVFQSYALIWEGETNKSKRLLQKIKQEAEKSGDDTNQGMCEHGMNKLKWELKDPSSTK